jgi:uridine kinase
MLLAFFVVPELIADLYGPFVEGFLDAPSLDPWSDWAQAGIFPEAFPYGWPLLLFMAFGHAIGNFVGVGYFGIAVLYLLADLGVLLALLGKEKSGTLGRIGSATFLYSLAPTPVLLLGISGSNDFFPMFLLMSAVVALTRDRHITAGVILGLAIGVKLVLLVALVAALLFVLRDDLNRKNAIALGVYATIGAIFSLFPLLYSEGFRQAISSSQDAIGPLTWGVESPGGPLLVAPILVGLSLVAISQLKRMNQELLILSVATPLFILGALPGAPLGWSLWGLPLILLLVSRLPLRFLVFGYVSIWLEAVSAFPELGFFATEIPVFVAVASLGQSSSLFVSLVLLGLLWREYVLRSDFIKLRKEPALVLIAGDSGAGKDTLADGITRALGQNATVHVSGDDYHLWDRGNGSWNYLTHLNPLANDLDQYFTSIIDLMAGKSIRVGKYDHSLGRRRSAKTAVGQEFVISSGLHALWSKDVNSLASLRVFLSMSDELRLELKVKRDVADRGHSLEAVINSARSRVPDYEKYIEIQKSSADLAVHSSFTQGSAARGKEVVIEFGSDPKVFDSKLLLELNYTCGLETELELQPDGVRLIRVIGKTTPEMLRLAFQRLEPEVFEVINFREKLSEGAPGIVQLVALVYLANALRRERLIR